MLYEGREALPKLNVFFMGNTARSLSFGHRRLDNMDGERSHRQLIDCIRSKETEALIDAVEGGGRCKLLVKLHYL